MIVTDIPRTDKRGNKRFGYYMDGYLKENFDGIPAYLKKGWDVVGIISGHGKVRMGKSTLGMQSAYYIAWLLAGGRVHSQRDDITKKWIITGMTKPKKEVHFNLHENVVFNAKDLMTAAHKLYEKYGPSQVIVYDEGRQGLAANRAMENLNKFMEDFFQECGFMGHVIFIILPDFFKLHPDYSVSRSLFLIDCFADKKKRRGYFNFYDENQKEWLYFLGKKRLGIQHKYGAASESFWGRFNDWLPFDKTEYEALKKKAMLKKQASRQEVRWKHQRDALIYILKNKTEMKLTEIAQELSIISSEKVSPESMALAIANVTKERVQDVKERELEGEPEEEVDSG